MHGEHRGNGSKATGSYVSLNSANVNLKNKNKINL